MTTPAGRVDAIAAESDALLAQYGYGPYEAAQALRSRDLPPDDRLHLAGLQWELLAALAAEAQARKR